MHCLPRTDELDADVDETPQNKYFQQARHGVAVRSATLLRALGHRTANRLIGASRPC
jgi:aspartate carbamoyltransferase catalytic subunit